MTRSSFFDFRTGGSGLKNSKLRAFDDPKKTAKANHDQYKIEVLFAEVEHWLYRKKAMGQGKDGKFLCSIMSETEKAYYVRILQWVHDQVYAFANHVWVPKSQVISMDPIGTAVYWGALEFDENIYESPGCFCWKPDDGHLPPPDLNEGTPLDEDPEVTAFNEEVKRNETAREMELTEYGTLKKDPTTRAFLIQRIKDRGFPIMFNIAVPGGLTETCVAVNETDVWYLEPDSMEPVHYRSLESLKDDVLFHLLYGTQKPNKIEAWVDDFMDMC